MVYDREGRKLWIVEDTGRHKPVGTWEEISKRPRRPDLPDWWVVAKDIAWRPPVPEFFTDAAGHIGTSLLSMHPEELERALAAAPGSGGTGASGAGSGGTGTKLGCGGKCQEQYDTATGKYTGNGGGSGDGGGTGGGQTRTTREPAKTKAPPKTTSAPTRSYKAAGADSQEARAKLPENNPAPPPGVNVDDNIREADAHKGNLIWFYNQVDSYGPWDYKNVEEYKKDGSLENFGNFNYGATGAALGVPDEVLYRAAGAKQIWDHRKDPAMRTDPLIFPYGDEHKDAEMIRRGIEYYRQQKLLGKL